MKENHLIDLDWFDENFWTFFSENNKIIKKFNDKVLKIKNDSKSSRILNKLKKEGLLGEGDKNSIDKHFISISERIWMNCVIELRSFGLSYNKIKKVKGYLSKYQSSENQSLFPQIDFYINYGLSTGKPVNLIVFKNGNALIGRQYAIEYSKQFNLINSNFISIDLLNIVNNMLKKNKYSIDYINYSKSEIEKEIFKSIYLENVDTIRIKNTKDEKILVNKQKYLSSKREMESMLNKLDYAEGSTVKKGKIKFHKIEEQKRIKK